MGYTLIFAPSFPRNFQDEHNDGWVTVNKFSPQVLPLFLDMPLQYFQPSCKTANCMCKITEYHCKSIKVEIVF